MIRLRTIPGYGFTLGKLRKKQSKIDANDFLQVVNKRRWAVSQPQR
jgi:hypothetical protein